MDSDEIADALDRRRRHAIDRAANAQDVAGTWQVTLNAGKDLRVVRTFASAAGGGLSGMLHSIDQSPQGISVNPLTLQGTTGRFAVSAIGVVYQGQLSANGSSITGSWSQGGLSLPLTLMRATPETAWPIPAPPKAIAAYARAVFEVATIKPSNAGELPVRSLTVGTGGPRLTPNGTNPNGLPGLMFKGLGVLPALNANMADLASALQTAVLDRRRMT